MTCGRMTQPFQENFQVASTVARFIAATPWIYCTGLDKVQAMYKLMNRSGSYFNLDGAYQTAVFDVKAPDAPTAFNDAVTQNNTGKCSFQDISATTTGQKLFIRFGGMAFLGQGTAAECADILMQFAYGLRGKQVGTFAQQIIALDTNPTYLPISGWFSTLESWKVKAGFEVTLGANFSYLLAYQTATLLPSAPDAWSDLEGGSYTTGNGQRCTGEQTPTISGKMWMRLGIKYKTSSTPEVIRRRVIQSWTF